MVKIWEDSLTFLNTASCNNAINSICYLSVLNDPDENQKILKKLPNHLAVRWSWIIDEWITEESVQSPGEQAHHLARKQEKVGLPFQNFANSVISLHALKGDDKEDCRRNGMSTRHRKPPEAGAFATGVREGSESSRVKIEPKINMCLLCESEHELDNCPRFTRLLLPERRQSVQLLLISALS